MMRNVPANAMFFPGKPHDNYYSSLLFNLDVISVIKPLLKRLIHILLIALFITVNELVKSNVASFRNKSTDNLSMPERLFAGACAGLCYWVGTFPLDAIKVRTSLKDHVLRDNNAFGVSASPYWSSLQYITPTPTLYSTRHPLYSYFHILYLYSLSPPLPPHAQARVQASPFESRQGWLQTAQLIYREGPSPPSCLSFPL